MTNKGNISIHAQNIMPIIKKWLYSDKDIFVREMVSNGCDAITKRRLAEPDAEASYQITVTVDEAAGALRFADNGIGMTEEELEKYINQVAFSGAEDFLKKYGLENKETNEGIIGLFGLGFYSSFMVAKKVEIDTLSFQAGAEAVKWSSEDGMEFSIESSGRKETGTTITLFISDEEKEFLSLSRIREVLEKYCAFLPMPIYLVSTKEEEEKKKATKKDKKKDRKKDAKKAEEKKKEEGKADSVDADILDADSVDIDSLDADEEDGAPKPINDIKPLWTKRANDCTEEEYKDFYTKVFHEFEPPLFWVHLNVDHPFNLQGILYFPKLKQEFGGMMEGPIKLYCGQVFVADNIKEVIPEFLTLLKGVIDCPDLPLNVSRSFLQNDGYVKKLSAYITRKVADKLTGIFNTDRESYEKYWDDIHPFIKFGCMKDESFYDRMKETILFKTIDDQPKTIAEYFEGSKEKDRTVYYATDAKVQAASVALYQEQGIKVALLDSPIDSNFISFLEYKDEKTKFRRVDADLSQITSKEKNAAKEEAGKLTALFRDALSKDDLEVSIESFRNESLHAMIIEDEQMRRFKDMSRFYGGGFSMPGGGKLVLNGKSPVIEKLRKREAGEETTLICRQLYDLAEMARQPLEAEAMGGFIERSNQLLTMLYGKNET